MEYTWEKGKTVLALTFHTQVSLGLGVGEGGVIAC